MICGMKKNDHSFSTPKPLTAAAVLTAVLAIAVTSFAWPAANLEPRSLPVGVVGAAQLPEGMEAHRYPSEAAAAAAIRDREIYGAVIAERGAPRVLVASAASPAVAQSLRQQAGTGTVRDVVPAPEADPRGAAFSALLLPLILGGIVTAVLGMLLLTGRARLGWLVGAPAGAGLLTVAIVQGGFGVLEGDWLLNAGVLALGMAAVAATVAGLVARVGRAGIGAGALLMILVGNPWSGVTSAPELLPEPAGTIGQLLPPGAAGSLLRSVAFFDGAGAAAPLAVLAVWTLAGLAAVAAAGYVRASSQAAMSSTTR
jgi:hypothetical protein